MEGAAGRRCTRSCQGAGAEARLHSNGYSLATAEEGVKQSSECSAAEWRRPPYTAGRHKPADGQIRSPNGQIHSPTVDVPHASREQQQ